ERLPSEKRVARVDRRLHRGVVAAWAPELADQSHSARHALMYRQQQVAYLLRDVRGRARERLHTAGLVLDHSHLVSVPLREDERRTVDSVPLWHSGSLTDPVHRLPPSASRTRDLTCETSRYA